MYERDRIMPRLGITGHRKLPWGYSSVCPQWRALVRRLREIIRDCRPEECCTGMALGADQAFVEACRAESVPYVAFVPCAGQERLWPIAARAQYRVLLQHAGAVRLTSDGEYTPGAMQKRNQAMIDWLCEAPGSSIIAAWDGRTTGGTFDMVCRAMERELAIIQVDPRGVLPP